VDFTWEKTPLVEKLKEAAHAGNGHAVSNGKPTAAPAKKSGKAKSSVARA
jgi:hypothetical protein